ncbi:protein-L-isoaspartate O-methyltransferase family protein [Thiohalorhabdus methylotrophus]|uniref:Protein-L-isoaspartate O-methyltransferase n=1 Tax=Thiohalorhabdus methylotrophus TaxID=3242694 RepID=A0ABV4TXK0_9GAMM
MDFDKARHNMIESQVRTWEVLDDRILTTLDRIPRHEFVPEESREWAYIDYQIPLGIGEYMLSPLVEARLLQELRLNAGDKVLEVGTGSGYVTALLAELAGEVWSVEVTPGFKVEAEQRLASREYDNVHVEVGDGSKGWERQAPYDAVLVTGAMPYLPDDIKEQLNIGGRLVCILDSDPPVQEAYRITRLGADAFREDSLFELEGIPHLRGVEKKKEFVF